MNRDNALLLSIASHDGWNRLSIRCSGNDRSDANEVLFGELEIEGDFWERRETESGPAKSDPRIDYKTRLFQIRMEIPALKQLKKHLRDDTHNFGIHLSEQDPKLDLTVGPRTDFVSTLERPVFCLRYQTQRMKAEWAFVVDPSILHNLMNSLDQVLIRL
jgi:hypothetical protein